MLYAIARSDRTLIRAPCTLGRLPLAPKHKNRVAGSRSNCTLITAAPSDRSLAYAHGPAGARSRKLTSCHTPNAVSLALRAESQARECLHDTSEAARTAPRPALLNSEAPVPRRAR